MIVQDKKLYDTLKWVAQVLLPALGALYFGLAGIWNLPSAEQVVGTIVVVDTFLGVILQISTANYNKGVVQAGDMQVFETHTGGKNFTLALDDEPEALADAKEVRFKVVQKGPLRGQPGEEGLSLLETLIVLAIVLALVAVFFATGVFK